MALEAVRCQQGSHMVLKELKLLPRGRLRMAVGRQRPSKQVRLQQYGDQNQESTHVRFPERGFSTSSPIIADPCPPEMQESVVLQAAIKLRSLKELAEPGRIC